ncbi:MAG: hypothetical protein AB9882_08155 [Ignavibacteriaceae bacterium]
MKSRTIFLITVITLTISGVNVTKGQNSQENVPPFPRWVAYFADAVYTVREAEGGATGLSFDTSIGEVFTDPDGVMGVRTKPEALSKGELISGPSKSHSIYYGIIEDSSPILYTATYYLKIENLISGAALPDGFADSLVCQIRICYREPATNSVMTLSSAWRNIFVRDFINEKNGWNKWSEFSFQSYDFSSVAENNIREGRLNGLISGRRDLSSPIEYQVIWNGLSFLRLYTDKIVIYDSRGIILMNDFHVREQIKEMIKDENDPMEVFSWYGLEEEGNEDNYSCLRLLDNLIEETYPRMKNHLIQFRNKKRPLFFPKQLK